MKVLLVDDNPVNRFLPATLLRRSGHEVVEAENGPEALEKAQQATFDCVLLDISMPGMSGIEVCQKLRADFGRGLRIVAQTAHAEPEDRPALLSVGFDEVLFKPIRKDSLLASLGQTVA